MEPHSLAQVKESMASWLTNPAWDWNWVTTVTFDQFKCPLHANIVKESFDAFMRRIARDAMVAYGFVFGERGGVHGRPHWHSVAHVSPNLLDDPRRSDIWEFMFDRYGRTRIEPFRMGRAVINNAKLMQISDGISRYLSKYLAKDAARDDATWDFRGFEGGRESDPKRICAALGLETFCKEAEHG